MSIVQHHQSLETIGEHCLHIIMNMIRDEHDPNQKEVAQTLSRLSQTCKTLYFATRNLPEYKPTIPYVIMPCDQTDDMRYYEKIAGIHMPHRKVIMDKGQKFTSDDMDVTHWEIRAPTTDFYGKSGAYQSACLYKLKNNRLKYLTELRIVGLHTEGSPDGQRQGGWTMIMSQTLKTIVLDNCRGFRVFECGKLCSFQLRDCDEISISSCPKLTELDMKDCRQYFSISNCEKLSSIGTGTCDKIFISTCPKLHELDISNCGSLLLDGQFPGLKNLSIFDCVMASDFDDFSAESLEIFTWRNSRLLPLTVRKYHNMGFEFNLRFPSLKKLVFENFSTEGFEKHWVDSNITVVLRDIPVESIYSISNVAVPVTIVATNTSGQQVVDLKSNIRKNCAENVTVCLSQNDLRNVKRFSTFSQVMLFYVEDNMPSVDQNDFQLEILECIDFNTAISAETLLPDGNDIERFEKISKLTLSDHRQYWNFDATALQSLVNIAVNAMEFTVAPDDREEILSLFFKCDFSFFLSHMKKMERIDVACSDSKGKSVVIAKMDKLEHVFLKSFDYVLLYELPALKNLTIEDCLAPVEYHEEKDEDLMLKKIRSKSSDDRIFLTDGSIGTLQTLTLKNVHSWENVCLRTQKLELDRCKDITIDGSADIAEIVLQNCENVTVRNLANLQKLEITSSRNIIVKDLPQLKELRIHDCDLTGIHDFPELKDLFIKECECFGKLSGIPKIKSFVFHGKLNLGLMNWKDHLKDLAEGWYGPQPARWKNTELACLANANYVEFDLTHLENINVLKNVKMLKLTRCKLTEDSQDKIEGMRNQCLEIRLCPYFKELSDSQDIKHLTIIFPEYVPEEEDEDIWNWFRLHNVKNIENFIFQGYSNSDFQLYDCDLKSNVKCCRIYYGKKRIQLDDLEID